VLLIVWLTELMQETTTEKNDNDGINFARVACSFAEVICACVLINYKTFLLSQSSLQCKQTY